MIGIAEYPVFVSGLHEHHVRLEDRPGQIYRGAGDIFPAQLAFPDEPSRDIQRRFDPVFELL
jgi:hypothetical protein